MNGFAYHVIEIKDKLNTDIDALSAELSHIPQQWEYEVEDTTTLLCAFSSQNNLCMVLGMTFCYYSRLNNPFHAIEVLRF